MGSELEAVLPMQGGELKSIPSGSQSDPIQIGHDEVHVWVAGLDSSPVQTGSDAPLLCAEESLRADRFRLERDRERFVVRRSILRTLLGMYIGRQPEHLEFRCNIYGKPMLAGKDWSSERIGSEIRFNVSHSHGFALYAFTRGREIGVDIERIRRIAEMDQIAEIFFSARENVVYRTFSESLKKSAFFNCWTQKEAYVKANGEGFSRSLDGFDVSLDPAEPAGLLRVDKDPGAESRWTIQKVGPFDGYAAAFAVEGPVRKVQCLHWPDHFPAFYDHHPGEGKRFY